MKKKLRLKVKVKLTIMLAFLVITLGVLLGVSYGFFITTEESNEQIFTTGTLAVDYQKKTNVINLKDMYPMTNRQGMNLESHEFTVKNNGNMKAKYLVRLELKTNEKKMVDLKYIRMTYSKNNNPYTTPILLSELESNLIFVKDQEILSERADKYAIKMWIDKDAPNEIQGKEFSARIVVDSIQESEENYDIDTIPVIYLNTDEQGNKDVTIKKGTEYVELGVKKVEDDKDNLSINDVTKSYEYYNASTEELEEVEGINTNQKGIYYITYRIKDSNNHEGMAVRVVNVVEEKEPRIELVGQESIILEENDTYTEEGVTVDNKNKVTIIGEVKTEVIGVYIIRYIVVDEENNIKSVVRQITVNEKPEAPEITGGSTSWVAVAPTISMTQEGKATSGVKEYEYYKITSETTPAAPTKTTVATGTLNKENTDLKIEDEGTTYVYYRTVSNSEFKSAWSSPQVVNLETLNPIAPILKNTYSSDGLTSTISIGKSGKASSGIKEYEYYRTISPTPPNQDTQVTGTTIDDFIIEPKNISNVKIAVDIQSRITFVDDIKNVIEGDIIEYDITLTDISSNRYYHFNDIEINPSSVISLGNNQYRIKGSFVITKEMVTGLPDRPFAYDKMRFINIRSSQSSGIQSIDSYNINVKPHETYYIYYRTVSNSGKRSDWSEPQIIKFKPEPPTLSIINNNTSSTISIHTPGYANNGIKYYEYYRTSSAVPPNENDYPMGKTTDNLIIQPQTIIAGNISETNNIQCRIDIGNALSLITDGDIFQYQITFTDSQSIYRTYDFNDIYFSPNNINSLGNNQYQIKGSFVITKEMITGLPDRLFAYDKMRFLDIESSGIQSIDNYNISIKPNGTYYTYYRTVSNSGMKSEWSTPAVSTISN